MLSIARWLPFALGMIRVVLDTVVFVRSLINPHDRWGTLVFDYAGHFTLVTSEPVVRELLEVLQRPELVGKFPALADRDPHVILDLLSSADDVEVVHVPAVSRDPKDDAFLATAKAGKADYLVSE